MLRRHRKPELLDFVAEEAVKSSGWGLGEICQKSVHNDMTHDSLLLASLVSSKYVFFFRHHQKWSPPTVF